MRKPPVLILLIGISLISLMGCDHRMRPLSPIYLLQDLDNIPLILEGQVSSGMIPIGASEHSEWDGRLVQLYKVRVEVERIFQGHLDAKQTEIYFFSDIGFGSSGVSPVRYLNKGNYEIFFLLKDNTNLRTIYDGWRNCIWWVRTGSHRDILSKEGELIEDRIMSVLLGRGENTTDSELIDAIYHLEWGLGTIPVFNSLKNLARNERSPLVHSAACNQLRNLLSSSRSPSRPKLLELYRHDQIYASFPGVDDVRAQDLH